ncbi:MAG: MotA/TolQ/ExbB proton channel family protein, partial [Desulfobacterales bacterium]|nr:MotA/TolQ/ExbB proton channel family protein [Desulfobacterales bacterium]
MKRDFPFSFDFLYQVFSLIIIVIIVHAIYVAVIRPRADTILAKQAIQMAENEFQVTERSVFVLIRDYEQEACFVLMFWAIAIMGYKAF